MKKILVTTDFSDNSKAGIYFALQIASQEAVELSFFHSCNIKIPVDYIASNEALFIEESYKNFKEKLQDFVAEICKVHTGKSLNYSCIVKSAPFTEANIMEYAKDNGFNFICISTRGASKLERILGTNTANIINFSEVPVIAVPDNYKASSIQNILYASDIENLKEELDEVILFAKTLKAIVHVIHFLSFKQKMRKADVEEIVKNLVNTYPIKVSIESRDNGQSVIKNLKTSIESIKPSMLVMFTEQNRNLFQQIFLSSDSAEYSFDAKVPVLVFKKRGRYSF